MIVAIKMAVQVKMQEEIKNRTLLFRTQFCICGYRIGILKILTINGIELISINFNKNIRYGMLFPLMIAKSINRGNAEKNAMNMISMARFIYFISRVGTQSSVVMKFIDNLHTY
ncbi:hypothetical protein Bind_0703 [Beijerinckia indica subsp. indica ATCC 9039]|uniref:Uncharacterized protein n=1 Tax=Beijerinckia indica subsp. indica (strain ATCC 9039 / DSM 1715 / NCIMB 8712) TaxID=395963 RepID=B2IGH1_BEII9|nr:hypothetical protein Bind_0703 [Beijerinckia indica subsp. indica ATCC 9039]